MTAQTAIADPAALAAPIGRLWVYLGTTPLLWLLLTVGAYALAVRLQQRLRGSPFVNPVLIAVLVVVALLTLSDTPYEVYFNGAQFVHFLLGTATVALAIPLRRQWPAVRAALTPLTLALLVGNMVGALSAMWMLKLFGAPSELVLSIAPKSVTAPVAMGIADKIGGVPELTAVLVVLTGMLGATMATPLLNALRIDDPAARGLAVGIAAHGIGTARAFQVSEVAGTFAGIGMAASTIAASLLVPLAIRLV
ncbi:LrgB family protein [Piscinibacter sakaiensis]|uniref:LrgB family protein n=1 Tax=Piscinibacter sakaiensis TaxID=1547922 RepID=UPI003AAEBD0C